MDLFALLELKKLAETLKLSDDPSKFSDIVKTLGVSDDNGLVEQVVNAARIAASSPEDTVMNFVQNGGLVRMLAGQKKPESQDDEMVLNCPHCEGVLILHAG